jgi:uncharacterized protein (DUF362 family)
MVLDLIKILLYANSDGSMKFDEIRNKKRYISIVDAIVSGEGNGPDAPEKIKTGLLIFGTNPVSVDATCAKLMGFDWAKIPTIRNAFALKSYHICKFGFNDIRVVSSLEKYNKPVSEIHNKDIFNFKPSVGWVGNIES